jgi:hypothetical protein
MKFKPKVLILIFSQIVVVRRLLNNNIRPTGAIKVGVK